MDQQLVVFVKVAERQSFSRAAEELHLTQPAVSQHIQSLERTFGVRLLDRNNKYVRLNKAGEIVYHHAKEILGLYDRMSRLVDDLSNTPSGKLTIGASYTFGEYVLPHIIAVLRKRFPRLQPVITIGNTKEIADQVRNRKLDVGLIEGKFHYEKLHAESFDDDFMYVYAGSDHPLVTPEEVSVEQLQQITWIVREDGSGTREAVENLFKMLQIRPQHILEFGSTQLIKESVEAGLGVTLLSQWATKKEMSLGTLRSIRVPGTPFVRQFSIITQASSFRTKAVDVFWDLVRDSRKKITAGYE
jgi:DNA-binding transcriptional LysR family regulator